MALPEFILAWKAAALALPPTTIVFYLLFALLAINTAQRVRRWYRLRHIPGPWICGFTSLWLVNRLLGPRIDKDWKKLVDTYGAWHPVTTMVHNYTFVFLTRNPRPYRPHGAQ